MLPVTTVVKRGHYDKLCLNQVQGHERHSSTRWKTPTSAQAGKSPTLASHYVGHRGIGVRRVHSPSRPPYTTSPTVVVTFIHYRRTHNLSMLLIQVQMKSSSSLNTSTLWSLSTNDSKLPPDTPSFTADGSAMKPALESFRAELQVKAKKITM